MMRRHRGRWILLELLAGAWVFAANPNAEPDALVRAAHRNDFALVDSLLRAGAKASAANSYGVTAVAEAAANGNAAMIERLLAAGADPNAASGEGETPLMAAARAGSAEAVRSLIKHGANVNGRENWKGQTALMWAAAANRAEAARVLIEHGADVNAHSTIWPPDTVKRPKNGNIVSDRPKGGLTPLLYAAREGAVEAAQVLMKGGANLDLAEPDGTTPLVVAILNAHYDLAALLLEAGADPNLPDKYGRMALYAAIDMNSLEPSVTRPAPKEDDRLTALDVARMALAHGANPNTRLRESTPGRGLSDNPDPILRAGTTAFLRAAKTGDTSGMRLLLEHGADPKIATEEKTTPLMAASGFGWRYGDSQIQEQAALEAVKLCVELGADVNASNDSGETALHGAALRGADQIAQYLVEKGAKLDAKDKRGHTALDIAGGDESRGNPGFPRTAAVLRQLMGGAAQAPGAPELKLKQLHEDLYMLQAPLTGADGPNIVFYITNEGVILVDDRYEQNHERVTAEIRRVTGQPVRYVILTHRHGDSIVPNGTPPAVEMIAHANARTNMAESNTTGLPKIVFTEDMNLFLGGKEVRILHFGRAHTDGDAAIYFPARRTVAVGDLMAGTDGVANPVADSVHRGSIVNWPVALDGVLKLDINAVIPGTGAGVTTKAALLAYRTKIRAIEERVRGMLREGKSKDGIQQALKDEFSFKPINFRYFDGLLAELK
jgi:ankyrin repeat protein/glyoxylase-like metal-dependent hydrolase (beta-lactamase superfamily II)